MVNYISDRLKMSLAGHPVNEERLRQGKRPASVVLLRGAGMRLKLPSFEERHGLRACIVSPTKILGGASQQRLYPLSHLIPSFVNDDFEQFKALSTLRSNTSLLPELMHRE